jgi:uncharacterized protein
MLKWPRLFVALLIFLPLAAMAQDLPRPLSDTVSDFDNVLSPEAESRLTALLRKTRDDTGIHITVVTMDRREDHGGKDLGLEPYATALFNHWGIGDRSRNDGVMILVLRLDRGMRIELGSGYGTDWNRAAQRVIDDHFLPQFRKGDYETGIEQGTAQVIDRILRPFVAGKPAPKAPAAKPAPIRTTEKQEGGWSNLLMFAVLAAALAVGKAWQLIGDMLIRNKPCPQCGKKGLHRMRETLSPASRHFDGHGQTTTTCEFCDYRLVTPFIIPARGDDDDNDRGSSSSGSSGSSFGGGRSSGGGASGRW